VHACGVLSQPEDDLVRLLQNLADMDVTYNALQVKFSFAILFFHFCYLAYTMGGPIGFLACLRLSSSNCHGKSKVLKLLFLFVQATDIGRQVNGLRKHSSAEVRRLVKQLIR
jgi:hypothetical protein